MQYFPFVLSSDDEGEQLARAVAFSQLIERLPERPLEELAGNVALISGDRAWRYCAVVSSTQELKGALESYSKGAKSHSAYAGNPGGGQAPSVIWTFGGQGGWRPGAGRGLFAAESVFRTSIEECDAAFRHYENWSVVDELMRDADGASDRPVGAAILLFSLQRSLCALWRHWGVQCSGVIGHSAGEVAAAHVAGALSLADAADIVCSRSHLLAGTQGQGGGMASVGLSFDEASDAIAGLGDAITVAAINGPASTVLSGNKEALKGLIEVLQARHVRCAWLADVAGHSPAVDMAADLLLGKIGHIKPHSSLVPFYSTVTGGQVPGIALGPSYWRRNMREAVNFWGALMSAVQDGHSHFLEMGANPVLSFSIEEGFRRNRSRKAKALPSLRNGRDERGNMIGAAALLYAEGANVPWHNFFCSR